jgi:hypothetical protein
MEPRVMAHSQTYRLRERMAEAAIGHGQEVRADLTGIRVSAQIADWRSTPDPKVGVIFFCTMGSIKVREVLSQSDGRSLPGEVILEGLEVPEPGTYDIVNALIHSNGALQVKVDSATQVVQRARTLTTAEGWV